MTPEQIKDLESLALLRDRGVLTEVEFQQQKAQMLGGPVATEGPSATPTGGKAPGLSPAHPSISTRIAAAILPTPEEQAARHRVALDAQSAAHKRLLRFYKTFGPYLLGAVALAIVASYLLPSASQVTSSSQHQIASYVFLSQVETVFGKADLVRTMRDGTIMHIWKGVGGHLYVRLPAGDTRIAERGWFGSEMPRSVVHEVLGFDLP